MLTAHVYEAPERVNHVSQIYVCVCVYLHLHCLIERWV